MDIVTHKTPVQFDEWVERMAEDYDESLFVLYSDGQGEKADLFSEASYSGTEHTEILRDYLFSKGLDMSGIDYFVSDRIPGVAHIGQLDTFELFGLVLNRLLQQAEERLLAHDEPGIAYVGIYKKRSLQADFLLVDTSSESHHA